MSWLRIDDGFVEHEKISDLGDRAFRLHMAALCYCARNLTDGHLSTRAVKVVCMIVAATKRHVVELEKAGLWRPTFDDGYDIKDYLEWNPSAAKVKAERRMNAERQASHRSKRNALRNGGSNGGSNGVSNAVPSRKYLPRAVPVARPPAPEPNRTAQPEEPEEPTLAHPPNLREMP